MKPLCKTIGLAFSLVTITASAALANSTTSVKAYGDILNNESQKIGTVTYQQGTEGVVLEVKGSGLTPGKHGMHFHHVGTCNDHHHFKEAGGHIMPSGKPHGFLHPEGPHEGNLPNLIVGEDGSFHVELYTELVTINKKQSDVPALLDEDGSVLMVHANPDDHLTQPIGGSGARVACSVVKAGKGE